MSLSRTSGDAGEYVGRYRLVEQIGEGGMGVVHRAVAPDGTQVAVKVLRPHIVGDEEARARLAREVAALSRVRSERVAEFLDADPFGPRPYVVTRYVPALSLDEYVRRHGRLNDAMLRQLLTGLVQALEAIHGVGVLHRDVKPSNVLIDDTGVPVLIDFGLARMAEDPRLTATGWLIGTPGYLAPEILYGDEPTPAADVHAMAATVVFAATGHPPAGRGPAMAIMDRVRRGEFDLGGVPDWLEPILVDCLAPEPGDRAHLIELSWAMDADDPPAPAPEATIRFERTQLLQADPEATQEPEPEHRGRQWFALLGIAAAATALTAFWPYVGAVVLAVVVALLRFASVTAQRHGQRRRLRGADRWYDVPASVVSSPAYLVASLAGTLLLLVCSVLCVLVAGLILEALGADLRLGVAVGACVYVVALCCGPGSARVRRALARMSAPLRRPTRSGPLTAAVGAIACVALFAALAANGPSWVPTTHAPWQGTWLARFAGK